MSVHALEIRDLYYSYPDGTEALKGISFGVVRGSAVALVGANGAGKSTLLHHLNGYLSTTRGEVRIGETLVTRKTASDVCYAVGMVFQDSDAQLFMPTVSEDVAFGPLNAGLSPEQVVQRVDTALERVAMTHVRERPPYRLSSGEKRSVAIATVLAMEPDILIMDEPSSNLDPRARRRLIELLRSFEHTRIIATHDLELAVEVCSRVIVLDEGMIVADGPILDILNDEALMLAHGLERPHILRHLHPHH